MRHATLWRITRHAAYEATIEFLDPLLALARGCCRKLLSLRKLLTRLNR